MIARPYYHRWQMIGPWWRIICRNDHDTWLARCEGCGLTVCLPAGAFEITPGCRSCREERERWSEEKRFMEATKRLHKWLAKRAVGRQLQLIRWFVECETLNVVEKTKATKETTGETEDATHELCCRS